jgi:hypothetical protein
VIPGEVIALIAIGFAVIDTGPAFLVESYVEDAVIDAVHAFGRFASAGAV